MQWLLVLIISTLFFAGYQTKKSKPKQTRNGNQQDRPVPDSSTITDISRFPFVVGLIILTNKKVVWKCGGCIIHSKYALTTATCMLSVPRELTESGHFRVRSNTSILEEGFEPFTDHLISQYYIHSGYGGHLNSYDNDIAVVMVLTPFTGRNEKPITIPEKVLPYDASDNTTVFTWHKLILESTNVSLTDYNVCRRMYQWAGDFITERMVCGSVHGRDDFCQDMEGSPLVWDGELLGLASFAHECSADHFPAVFTRVDAHRDWIKKYTH